MTVGGLASHTCPGEHSRELLAGAGFTASDIDTFLAEAVVA